MHKTLVIIRRVEVYKFEFFGHSTEMNWFGSYSMMATLLELQGKIIRYFSIKNRTSVSSVKTEVLTLNDNTSCSRLLVFSEFGCILWSLVCLIKLKEAVKIGYVNETN